MEDPRSRAPLKGEWRDGKGEDGMEWISGWEERGREVKREVIWERYEREDVWIGARGVASWRWGWTLLDKLYT